MRGVRQGLAGRGRIAGGVIASAVVLAGLTTAGPAEAWYRYGVGVVIGLPPLVVPAPVYPLYPAPVYAAPPAYVPVPAYPAAPVAAQTCYAGLVSCPLHEPKTVGQSCSCPAGSGQIFGAAG